MNKRTNAILLAASAAALLAACGAVGERHETTITRKWPAASIREIEVNEVDGNVTVDAGATDQIELVAHVTARGIQPRPNQENQGYFKSSIDGSVSFARSSSSRSSSRSRPVPALSVRSPDPCHPPSFSGKVTRFRCLAFAVNVALHCGAAKTIPGGHHLAA